MNFRFEMLGGKIVIKTIDSFSDVCDYDLVMNCTGFGAKKLCSDHDLVPIRGQVFKVGIALTNIQDKLADLFNSNYLVYKQKTLKLN